ncbi:hypothetical protein GALMADRAFT_140181 [Galerina marginata CBS 339.88]|uniref:RxLR effector protein n=1 Tax=Galerina marginata (strain CBS 339.88) TaxID=685588 RepID=A0A067SXD2_GALM3|nr:hypothetical protein GALMADRAFT_140181 [Galerina marginata CBS 339.88]
MSRLIATLAILSVALLAFATTADFVQQATVTLSLVRRYNLTSVHNLLRHDQARGQTIRSGRPTNDQIDNQAVAYLASVEIGEGPNATTCESSFIRSIQLAEKFLLIGFL